MLLVVSFALARPTESGTYSFDDTDTVVTYDGPLGRARVWYSTVGNNQVKQGDDDGDGVPDFVQLVASYTEDVLATYEAAGFRPLVSDDGAGGSDAMDVYLVDFHGDADGQYIAESCDHQVCSGYFVMENDFSGYGYSSDESAVKTLTSHELFHAEQAAYDNGGDVWEVEGTAVWAEKFYDPESEDFLWFADAYLEDTGRTLYEPPAGPIPTFAYATGLWWWFLTERYGATWMIDYLEAQADGEDLVDAMDARTDLATDWVDFAEYNLATGKLAGSALSYDFAADIGPPTFEDKGSSLDDYQRFYPLSTTYYKLSFDGGELWFTLAEDAPDVVYQLWSTDADGNVLELVAEPASVAGAVDLGTFDAGDYYFAGINPTLAEDSTHVEFCLGPAGSTCEIVFDSGDTGPTDTGGKTEEPSGCGCAASGSAAGGAGVLLGLVALTRRRR